MASYIFAGEFSDTLAGLTGSRVAFYGARSIEGATVAQVRSVTSTLSSLRLGQTAFTVAALSGADLGAGPFRARVVAQAFFILEFGHGGIGPGKDDLRIL